MMNKDAFSNNLFDGGHGIPGEITPNISEAIKSFFLKKFI